jgi:hypothetical protein
MPDPTPAPVPGKSLYQKAKDAIAAAIKPINDFLTAHPKFKNILGGLEKTVLASVVAYFATVLKTVTDALSSGAPMPHDFHCLLVGFGGGLYLAVSVAIRAWAQENHDQILAVVQDNAPSPQGAPVATSSVLTPIQSPKS